MHIDGRWYLLGHCLSRKALRTFRMDRTSDLDVCASRFHRPSDFDARSYLHECMPFIQSEYQFDVWIDMPIEEAERIFAQCELLRKSVDQGLGGDMLPEK